MKPLSLIASLTFAAMISQPAVAESFKDAFPEVYGQINDEFQARVGALELLHGCRVAWPRWCCPKGSMPLGPPTRSM